ncbi:hypothetical protein DS909_20065 [Phaeobacter gallaeciensis]|uniref:Uncharacterized protein n=2 Tax=Roseobacteraceae TaxID=2854170 RepID=A0A366WQL0_9RHOB|nr:hypothetical protein DS909_20065 [Phaeobacter gallaeciensis]
MAIGIMAAVGVESPSLLTKLLIAGITELGFAFFIAHIIVATVDEREKISHRETVLNEYGAVREKLRTAERRVAAKMHLSHVLDIELPKSISDELSEYLITSRLVKRKQRIVYQLESAGKYVKLTQRFDATLENVDVQNFEFQPTFSNYGTHKPDIENTLPHIKWGLNSSEYWTSENTDSHFEPINEIMTKTTEGQEFIKPITIAPGSLIRQKVCIIVPKYCDDNEIFTNKQFSENMEIEIRYDRNEFEVDYRFLHPRIDCCTKMESPQADILNFKYPFLPSHGIVVWWVKKQPKPS